MRLSFGATTVLAACAAAAAAAAVVPAVAGVATAAERSGSLPTAPAATLPATPEVKPPAAPERAPGAVLPEPLIPPLPARARIPETDLTAPLPDLLGKGTPRPATPAVPVRATTPALSLGLPFDAPEPGEQRLVQALLPGPRTRTAEWRP